MAETTVQTSQTDILREKLEKLPKKPLVELVKSLDIKFKDRTKAGRERIISNILNAIKPGILSIEDIEKELVKEKYIVLKEAKKSERLTKKDVDDFRKEVLSEIRKLYSIENRLSLLEGSIQNIDDKISQQSERLVSLQNLIEIPTEKVSLQNTLKIMRKLNINLREPQDFDNGIELLKKEVKLNEFVKMGNMAITISELTELVKKISWPEDLDFFYSTLKIEFDRAVKETGSTVPIYQIKQTVSKRLAISDKDFERQLISCFKKGWLTLDFRSPIGEEHTEYLDVDGRKYYVIRSILRV